MHRCRMSRSRLCARGATANPAPPRGCSAAASSPPCAVLLPVFLQNRRDPNFYHPPTGVGSLLDANVCIDSASQLQGIHGRLSDLPVLSLAMELISHQTSPAGKRQSVCGCVESLEGCERRSSTRSACAAGALAALGRLDCARLLSCDVRRHRGARRWARRTVRHPTHGSRLLQAPPFAMAAWC